VNELMEWLKPVQDPELHMGLVDLGLIYDVVLDPSGLARVQMTLTSPGCPMADHLVNSVKERLMSHQQVKEVDVSIVWEPQWNPAEMASEEAKEVLGIW
tara:strand:- start:1031 stop:1327 length:297 start_codon:yes stop_codon:yes gene_type:complete